MTLEAATSAVGYFSKVERLAAAGEAFVPVVVPRRACIEVRAPQPGRVALLCDQRAGRGVDRHSRDCDSSSVVACP
jgi:hypothetical protein